MSVQIKALVRAACELLGYSLRGHGIECLLVLDDSLLSTQADEDQVGQILLNLLINGQQALAPITSHRRIDVHTNLRQGDHRRSIVVCIADVSGPRPASLPIAQRCASWTERMAERFPRCTRRG